MSPWEYRRCSFKMKINFYTLMDIQMDTIIQLVLAIIGLLGASWAIKIVVKKISTSQSQENNQVGNGNNNQNMNFFIGDGMSGNVQIGNGDNCITPEGRDTESIVSSCRKEKGSVHILFIDDQKFDNVDVLRNAGWKNTKSIKDIKAIDCPEVLAADVIFVDINGVGTSLFPKEQGLGVAAQIKTRYSDKCVVVYSAQPQELHKALSLVDAVLPKNAEPYEYISILESYLDSH